jgi:hypothetical protein
MLEDLMPSGKIYHKWGGGELKTPDFSPGSALDVRWVALQRAQQVLLAKGKTVTRTTLSEQSGLNRDVICQFLRSFPAKAYLLRVENEKPPGRKPKGKDRQ